MSFLHIKKEHGRHGDTELNLPLAYWSMDEGSGNEIADSAGKGRVGNFVGKLFLDDNNCGM